MAKQDARKQFVQARLKAIGGDATPEQKAKLRQRFNKLSETKEGRTRIAQVVLPSATAEQRKALKQSLRPTKTSTTAPVTPVSPLSPVLTKVDLTGVRDARPYRPTVISDSSSPKNNSQSSAVIPNAQKTNVYGDTWEEKVALKLENWGVPVFGRVAGIGRAIDEGKTSTVIQKGTAAVLDALITGATFGTVLGAKKINNPSFPTNPFKSQKPTQFDPSKMRTALESYKGTPTTPSNITGANRPTSMPITPNFNSKPTPQFIPGGVDRYPTFKNPPGTKPPARSKPSKETPGGKPPTTTVPKTSTATTVPKPVTTTVPKKSSVTTVPTSVSPPTTAPRQYDPQGRGIGEPLDIRVGDPMPVKPAKPTGVSKVKFEMSDQMIDYEVRLANYYRYNKITPPKKK